MIFDSERFARRYALIYTSVLAILLIAPLVTYIFLLLQIDEAKIKIALRHQMVNIINIMQQYDNKEKIFHFPHYKEYDTALYDKNFKVIFSTLHFQPTSFTEGFHQKDRYYYHIFTLPHGHYFGADYLLVSTVHTAYDIYLFATLVLMGIVLTLYIFSLLLLRNFSAPFEKLNIQLDNFIKDSMHEINTPLSIINLNADLFATKYGENKYLHRMKAASKTLATIYNDMDYLIKRGRVQHRIEKIAMGDFIQQRIDYFQEIANLKNITLVSNIEFGVTYQFSRTKLQRIIDNTISNAIKYSHDNTNVEISLHCSQEDIVFSVKDFGVGIENIEKIFSRYYRENETKGGFGIGLNIVKQIIDEESILLKVISTPQSGAIFTYYFNIIK
ncbi:MAG: HAMP domain-containing histidine kinase [Sulfurovum sp.]|nr:HAMP domain-containing histidine kinase [Sulfurovum sp.]